MSKGSKQRPTDLNQFFGNYDKIKWTPPEGMNGSCGFPFCQCNEKCLDKELKMSKTEQMCLDAIKRLKHSINTSAGMHKRNFALMCEKKRKESERKEAHVAHA